MKTRHSPLAQFFSLDCRPTSKQDMKLLEKSPQLCPGLDGALATAMRELMAIELEDRPRMKLTKKSEAEFLSCLPVYRFLLQNGIFIDPSSFVAKLKVHNTFNEKRAYFNSAFESIRAFVNCDDDFLQVVKGFFVDLDPEDAQTQDVTPTGKKATYRVKRHRINTSTLKAK